MTHYKSDFLHTLHSRGFIHQGTNLEGLDTLLQQERVTGYIGFDATADSLHVGNLLGIMMLLHLQRTGHKPLVLIGGGTTKIGDPSRKDTSRQMLTPDMIQKNISSIKQSFSRFLQFGNNETDATLLNNADWLEHINYMDFLRDYGRHFSINRMLTFDNVRLRLEREQPLSFLEFNYMILQAYDFVALNKNNGCRLQMGGSDQWGNIVNGVELGRRLDCPTLFGLTCPLLTTASGTKMGKSVSGAIWLNAERLPPYEYWQFWRNTEDQDVIRFLKLYTLLSLDEIDRLSMLKGAEINEAKKILADEATCLAHGPECLPEIHQTVARLFEKDEQNAIGALEELTLTATEIGRGIPILSLLTRSGLTPSNSEARRMIRSRAIRWGGQVVEEETHIITTADFSTEDFVILSAGKKKHVAVILHKS